MVQTTNQMIKLCSSNSKHWQSLNNHHISPPSPHYPVETNRSCGASSASLRVSDIRSLGICTFHASSAFCSSGSSSVPWRNIRNAGSSREELWVIWWQWKKKHMRWETSKINKNQQFSLNQFDTWLQVDDKIYLNLHELHWSGEFRLPRPFIINLLGRCTAKGDWWTGNPPGTIGGTMAGHTIGESPGCNF